MNNYLVLLLLSALFLFSCEDKKIEDTGTLELNFQLKYNDAPLVMFDRYEYPNGMEFFFTRFNFFMSNLKISPNSMSSGNGKLLKEIEFLNLTSDHETAAKAAIGTTLVLEKVPIGAYSLINFDIGVPPELNAKRPRDFSNDNPLSDTAEYWDSWKSYIFSKTEGKVDTDGDGQAELALAYHIGSDETLRHLDLSRDFSIEIGQTTTVTIVIEMSRMFDDGTTIYDPLQTSQIHSLTQLGEANILAENLKWSFR